MQIVNIKRNAFSVHCRNINASLCNRLDREVGYAV